MLYLLVCAAFAIAGSEFFRGLPALAPAALVTFLSTPHYGATLLRVYDQREDRRAYFLFGVVATAALLAMFGVALVDRFTGSVLATIYLTWSGWHYTGQNYGISAMFVRRREIALEGPARHLLHASFVLSYLIVFLTMHAASAPVADPRSEVRMIPLGIPEALNAVAMPIVGVAYLATSAGWVVLLLRRGARLVDLAPVFAIAGVQAAWWAIPYGAHHFGVHFGAVPLSWDVRTDFFPWIACAHAVQYLWISSFYARSSGRWRGQTHYYAATLAAGSAVWILPALMFAPGVGDFDWNFPMLLAAVINIHHFILDGVIWKLRHSKIARVLIIGAPAQDRPIGAAGPIRRLVYAVAIASLVLTLHAIAERHVVLPAAWRAGDLAAVEASLDRQAWYGRTTLQDRYALARKLEASGQLQEAIEQYEISAGMAARVEPLRRLVVLRNALGDARLEETCHRLLRLEDGASGSGEGIRKVARAGGDREFERTCLRAAQPRRTGPATGRTRTRPTSTDYSR